MQIRWGDSPGLKSLKGFDDGGVMQRLTSQDLHLQIL
jgi:hypothetical protein